MNLFQCIYCDQYAELIVTDEVPHKARNNGIFLTTVSLALNLFTILLVVNLLADIYPPAQGWLAWYRDCFGDSWGADALFVLEATVVLFLLVRFLIGREDYYFATITAYSKLDPPGQKKVVRRGANYVLLSIGAFLLIAFLRWLL